MIRLYLACTVGKMILRRLLDNAEPPSCVRCRVDGPLFIVQIGVLRMSAACVPPNRLRFVLALLVRWIPVTVQSLPDLMENTSTRYQYGRQPARTCAGFHFAPRDVVIAMWCDGDVL